MASSKKVKDAKRNTVFGLIVTFFVGLVITIFTFTPWSDGEGEKKPSGKK